MLEVITEWQGPGRSPKLSITYWDGTGAGPAQSASDQMRAFWLASQAAISSSASATMRSEVREISPSNGQLVAAYVVSPGTTVPGTATGQPMADATQYLLRWNTGQVINGRRLGGRTFVPGVPQSASSGGNVSTVVRTGWDARMASFLVGAVRLGVWHRPTPATPAGGSFHQAVSGTCWTEFAVQRNRRG